MPNVDDDWYTGEHGQPTIQPIRPSSRGKPQPAPATSDTTTNDAKADQGPRDEPQ